MAKYNTKLQEEELKLHVAEDWFAAYDCKRKIGKIDFCVDIPATELGLYDATSALWAEAKSGTGRDIRESFVQLILTIGRSKTFTANQPPFFLGAFDAEKIAFLPYDAVMDVFAQNDFNWNVTPSDHATKEFAQLYEIARKTLEEKSLLFNYETDEAELRKFIRENFVTGRKDVSRIQITRNNFPHIYQKWRVEVMPSLDVDNWDDLRKSGIIDADFFLADILSENNKTLRKKLFVLLQSDVYEVKYGRADNGLELISRIGFNDGQKAHTRFWNRYTRPPRKDYWDFIVERRDLLVDQDVRERKGAFFTPRPWVELSQEYLAKALGETWQDDHYIWDCCAGTGNLEAGLTNKYNIWVSTLDKADVDVMHTRIKMMNEQVAGANGALGDRALPSVGDDHRASRDSGIGGANLLDSHVFQFDFLNDPFDKLPQGLKEIIDDPEKRKKLVIYINPPYAEAGSSGKKKAKVGVSNETIVHETFFADVGKFAKRELYAQFLARIYSEIKGCKIGEFSKLKALSGPYFKPFRQFFRAKLLRGFIAPGNTFDNVSGKFPIGFKIWDTDQEEVFTAAILDVYNHSSHYIGGKGIHSYDDARPLNDWLRPTWKTDAVAKGYLVCNGNDFQHQNEIVIYGTRKNETSTFFKPITASNLIQSCIYLSVRKCIPADWQNDRDQFLFPNDGWANDFEFQSDCLAYALFETVVYANGPNHWIPYTESEVGAKDCFASHFMVDYMRGKVGDDHRASRNPDPTQLSLNIDCGPLGDRPLPNGPNGPLGDRPLPNWPNGPLGDRPLPNGPNGPLGDRSLPNGPLVFSSAAGAVLDAGRELWRYYHAQPNANPNASYYDIRAHFQGRKPNGTMNATSDDAKYNTLLDALKAAHKTLAAQIAPKVYAYGFLRA